MPSTRDPILLLEPSNLLEPLNLADRHGDPASPSTSPRASTIRRGGYLSDDAAREKLPESVAMGAQRIRRDSFRRRSSATADGVSSRLCSSPARLPALQRARHCPSSQSSCLATPSLRSKQSLPSKRSLPSRRSQTRQNRRLPLRTRPRNRRNRSRPNPSRTNSSGSNQSVALTANPGTQPAVPDQPAPAAQDAAAGAATSCGPRNRASDDKCLEGGPAAPAPGPVPTAVPDRNSDGAPAASRTTAASPAKPRTAPQTIWELDDRTQQSVNRRATPRDTADQQTAADSNGQGARSSDRNAPDRSASDRNASDRNASDRNTPDRNIGTVIAGRIRTRLVHRAGAASAPETTARPPDTATAGRSRTSIETRTGAATGMKTMAAARTVASSAELRARTIA